MAYSIGRYVGFPILAFFVVWGALRLWRRFQARKGKTDPPRRRDDAVAASIGVALLLVLAFLGNGGNDDQNSSPETAASPTPQQLAVCDSLTALSQAISTGSPSAYLKGLHGFEHALRDSGDPEFEAAYPKAVAAERGRHTRQMQVLTDAATQRCNEELLPANG